MSDQKNRRESGFALILALLALLLLTTLGLALSSGTSVELQISTNQRWSESARYNAEAGLEYGKNLLMEVADWGAVLPAARTNSDWLPTAWSGTAPNPTPMYTRATRNFESYRCDLRGYGMGFGVVFDDGGTGGPMEYVSTIGGATLNGAFTLWVRRPVMWSGGNGSGTTLQDYPSDDVIMLVSEGVAPYSGATNTNVIAAMNRSVYVVEALLTRKGAPVLDQSQCNTRQGQAGSSSSGGNTSGCVALTEGRQITEALAGVTGAGSGDLK
jgi:hypothetical protein